MKINNFINYFIPKKYYEDKELTRKSKFIVWFVFIVNIIGVFFGVLMFFQNPGELTNIVLSLFFIPTLTFGIFHFRKKGSFIFTTHFFCGTFFIAMIFQPAATGGIFSPDLPTIYIIPIFALIMGNIRIGLFYASLTMIMLITYYILGVNDTAFFLAGAGKLKIDYFFFNLLLNFAVISFLVFRNEIIRLNILSELKENNILISHKQKEITDSITYAQRLQHAILPSMEFICKHFPDNFILYKPKDIVAGDFYWAEEINGLIFIAAADSTGHGVPGAMVSVVCSNALNRTVKELGLTETGTILNKTRELVVETFAKNTTDVKDGMDISLLCIDKQNKKAYWSGANNPLWYIRTGIVKEIKADKQPIGKTDNPKPFTTNKITLQENTIFYLFTDGYADQFGGPKGKKFKYKQFEQLLLSICDKPMQSQLNIIDQKFEDWKGKLEQIDDVCIIGIRL